MRVQIIHQSAKKTVCVLFDNAGQAKAKLIKPFFVSGEDAQTLAREFVESHPEMFPDDRKKQANFDMVFSEERKK